MYPVSQEYIDAINARTRTTRMSGVITLSNGNTVNIADTDIVQGSLYITRKSVSGNVFDIGSVVASEMGLSLYSYDGTVYSLAGANITLYWGIETVEGWYDIPLGIWRVDDAKRKQRVVSIKAFDGMMRLDMDLSGVAKSGTPYELITSLATRCGVTFGMTLAQVSALPNGTMSLSIPAKSSIETCRDLLMWIAQLTGTFACFDRAGQLVLRQHGKNSVRTITRTERLSADVSDDTVRITQLAMVVGGTAYISSTVTWDGFESTYSTWDELEGLYATWDAIESNAKQGMQLDENPLITGKSASQISTALYNLLNSLKDVSYSPASLEYINDPALDCGDIVTLTDTGSPSGLNANVLITGDTWRYRGRHTIKAADKPSFDEGALPVRSQTEKRVDSVYSGGGGTKIHISPNPPDSTFNEGEVWLQYTEVV